MHFLKKERRLTAATGFGLRKYGYLIERERVMAKRPKTPKIKIVAASHRKVKVKGVMKNAPVKAYVRRTGIR
jgi:hypothetical protein